MDIVKNYFRESFVRPAGCTLYPPMFARKLRVERVDAEGRAHACPIAWIDNFAMRNFTNEAIFDDTLPAGDGLLEVGYRVPIDRLQSAMEDWFRRKGYLNAGDQLRVAVI